MKRKTDSGRAPGFLALLGAYIGLLCSVDLLHMDTFHSDSQEEDGAMLERQEDLLIPETVWA